MPLYPNVVFMCLPRNLTAASLRSTFRRHGEVISRSDGHSVVKDHRELSTPSSSLDKGVPKVNLIGEKKFLLHIKNNA